MKRKAHILARVAALLFITPPFWCRLGLTLVIVAMVMVVAWAANVHRAARLLPRRVLARERGDALAAVRGVGICSSALVMLMLGAVFGPVGPRVLAWNGWPVAAGLIVLCAATGFVLAGWLRFVAIARVDRLAREGRCQACSYDLRGLAAAQCPECGTIPPGSDGTVVAPAARPLTP